VGESLQVSPRIRGSSGGPAAVLAAATGMLVLLLGASSACGGSGDPSELRVKLTAPAGWAVLENGDSGGVVLAAQDGDLSAGTPQGPRLTAEPVSGALAGPEDFIEAMTTGRPGAGVQVLEPPGTVPVGTGTGTSIAFLEEDGGVAIMKRYILVNLNGLSVYQFLREAPQDQWAGSSAAMQAILASAAFEEVADCGWFREFLADAGCEE